MSQPLRILMFGWEFPPYKTGGLGTACHDLTKGLSNQGVEVTFVMPNAPDNVEAKFVKLLGANSIKNINFKISIFIFVNRKHRAMFKFFH